MIPFVGPSYALASRKADVQRSINLMLKQTESGTGKPALNFYLESVPGLAEFADLTNEIRGCATVGDRCFVVAGASLLEVFSDGTSSVLGAVGAYDSVVDMAYGLEQLVIVDGVAGYVLTLSDDTFEQITALGFYGADRVGYLDGYFIFNRPDTQQFYISAIDDATTLDALDFASSEASPDDLVALVVDHRELWLFNELTTEVWYNSGASDFPFVRNNGAFIEIGCAAKHTAQKIGNAVIWVGRDKNGAGQVFMATGYTPQRVSNFAVEEALSGSTDLASAKAYCYQQDGQTFYVLQAPGLETTLVYETTSGQWHDRADLVDGSLSQHRGNNHVYAFGKHLVGAGDGILYEQSPDYFTNDGDVLYRERTSPHTARPDLERIAFNSFKADITVGFAPQDVEPSVELSWSDDGGNTWGNWLSRSMGAVGEYSQRVEWHRLGQARDRVWKLRCTSNARFAIVGASVL